MKKILITILLFSTLASAQEKKTISGYVTNEMGESLIHAYIWESASQKSTITNAYGFYSLQLDTKKKLHLEISYLGYTPKDTSFVLTSSMDFDVVLHSSNDIETVDVIADAIVGEQHGVLKISPKQIGNIPSLTGEVDVLKAYQLLPGIASGIEGSNALYVRGGSPDQNLILLDDVQMYDVSHMGGFISVFDESAIKSVSVMKGAFPAQYGGRLSSVVDIRMKDGNMKTFHAEMSLSLLLSKFFIEGPLVKDKTSFMFSARRSNIDIFTGAAMKAIYAKAIRLATDCMM